MKLRTKLITLLERLPARQRQYVNLALLCGGTVGILWAILVFSADDKPKKAPPLRLGQAGKVTSMTVPGTVAPIDAWVGTAGKKLAQYEADKADQAKINDERAAAEARLLKRIADLESAQAAAAATSATATTQAMPPGAPPGQRGLPPGAPPLAGAGTALAAPPPVVRVTLAEPAAPAPAKPRENVGTYLPVSFFRGRLLGGMDAPTGGQAQSNPLPILLEATSNAFLPNGYRSEVKRCFVIGSGYGDISSERAYIRLISLSCVRHDGSTLEANLKGNVYGEDGKLGMRGRLVTKQGQLLANALRAGIVSGIGQGFAMSGTSVSSSALGAVATQSGVGPMRRGLSTGVGNAMETLANYYIRMAEQTFPVIEIDASREVDLVLTAGVKIGAPLTPLDEDDTAHQEERP